MAGELKLVSFKDAKKMKFGILLKGKLVSRHRTLSSARKKFNKALRIAKN